MSVLSCIFQTSWLKTQVLPLNFFSFCSCFLESFYTRQWNKKMKFILNHAKNTWTLLFRNTFISRHQVTVPTWAHLDLSPPFKWNVISSSELWFTPNVLFLLFRINYIFILHRNKHLLSRHDRVLHQLNTFLFEGNQVAHLVEHLCTKAPHCSSLGLISCMSSLFSSLFQVATVQKRVLTKHHQDSQPMSPSIAQLGAQENTSTGLWMPTSEP